MLRKIKFCAETLTCAQMSLINSLSLKNKRHLLFSLCISYDVQNDNLSRAKVIYVDHLRIRRLRN